MAKNKNLHKDVAHTSHSVPRRDVTLPTRRVLAGLRVEKGVHQRALSAALGRQENFINLLENGHRSCHMQDLFDICEELGASPAEIVERIMRWKA